MGEWKTEMSRLEVLVRATDAAVRSDDLTGLVNVVRRWVRERTPSPPPSRGARTRRGKVSSFPKAWTEDQLLRAEALAREAEEARMRARTRETETTPPRMTTEGAS